MYEYEQLICNTFTCSHFSVTNVVHAALNDRVLNPTHLSQLCFEGRHHDDVVNSRRTGLGPL